MPQYKPLPYLLTGRQITIVHSFRIHVHNHFHCWQNISPNVSVQNPNWKKLKGARQQPSVCNILPMAPFPASLSFPRSQPTWNPFFPNLYPLSFLQFKQTIGSCTEPFLCVELSGTTPTSAFPDGAAQRAASYISPGNSLASHWQDLMLSQSFL